MGRMLLRLSHQQSPIRGRLQTPAQECAATAGRTRPLPFAWDKSMFIESEKEHKNELASVQPPLQLVSLCTGWWDLRCAPGEGLSSEERCDCAVPGSLVISFCLPLGV